MTPDRKELLKAWIAAGLWIGLIAVESTEWLSAEHTGHFLFPIFRYLFHIDIFQFATVHHYLRKTGHFVGYFALSALLFRAWKNTLHLPEVKAWAVRWAATAWAMAVLVASLDEWHQTFIPSRTGTFSDVVLDSSAALTAQIVILLFLQFRARDMSYR